MYMWISFRVCHRECCRNSKGLEVSVSKYCLQHLSFLNQKVFQIQSFDFHSERKWWHDHNVSDVFDSKCVLMIFTFDANFVSVANEEYGMWVNGQKKTVHIHFLCYMSAITQNYHKIYRFWHQNFNAKGNNITINFSPPINLQTLKLTLKLFLWHVSSWPLCNR